MKLFTVIFEDNTTFSGGDCIETKWIQTPNKKIKSIFYILPSKDILFLTDFKRIYHFVEVTNDIMGENRGNVNLEFTHLLVERNNKITHYKIDLNSHSIMCEYLTLDSKFIQELNPDGWKQGGR
jgi:hypothetical protein